MVKAANPREEVDKFECRDGGSWSRFGEWIASDCREYPNWAFIYSLDGFGWREYFIEHLEGRTFVL